ncbi:hypothetical protein GX50_00428 [[Emmonsia] crescens]|uniref:Wax synthase domain-containing protein n=1 Tax=[Emmonsia] crescens TaxID=73230 RepID=A0A2B7ZU72_9EURO|nr:hypothetical protein GX50_00428 [Emmonsia crescens]
MSNAFRTVLPVFWLLAESLGIAFLVKYTHTGSLLRTLGFPCVAIAGYFIYTSSLTFSNSVIYNGTFATTYFVPLVHSINLLFLNPIDAQHVPGISIGLNVRGIGTPWLAKNTPEFPSYYGGRRPERFAFLLRQTAIVIWQYLAIDLFATAGSLQTPEEVQMLQGPGLEFAYLSATKEQWIARISTSLVTTFIMARMMLDIMARFSSIISVGLGLSNPSEWRPLFNSMWDAYTLRDYWGKFWHQLLRWPFTSISNHLTRRILHLPRHSLLERYLNVLIVFSLSGLMHVSFLAATGISTLDCWRGSMLYFTSFTLGFMIEDAAQALWRRLGVEGSQPTGKGMMVFKRVVGMLWVMTFLCMTSPIFGYPLGRVPAERREVIPTGYSVAKVVGLGPVLGTVGVGALFLKFFFGARL